MTSCLTGLDRFRTAVTALAARWSKRGPRTDNRRFLDALLWMAPSGGRWRDLPEHLSPYQSVKRRYYRWIEMGVLDTMLEHWPARPIWNG